MSDREEWGEWQDGAVGPRVGRYIQVECSNARKPQLKIRHEGIVSKHYGDEFEMRPQMPTGYWNLDRWRERKPRALQQLREMIETLPAPSRQKEDA